MDVIQTSQVRGLDGEFRLSEVVPNVAAELAVKLIDARCSR